MQFPEVIKELMKVITKSLLYIQIIIRYWDMIEFVDIWMWLFMGISLRSWEWMIVKFVIQSVGVRLMSWYLIFEDIAMFYDSPWNRCCKHDDECSRSWLSLLLCISIDSSFDKCLSRNRWLVLMRKLCAWMGCSERWLDERAWT